MMPLRTFLKGAGGLIVGFPFVIRSQLFPGSGIFMGVAERQKHPTGGGGGGADTPAITGQSLGTLRSNFSGDVGFRFFGSVGLTVTSLGRWVVSGNSQTHTVKFKDDGGSVLGSVSVNTSGATAGQYLYATLSSPISIGPTFYRVESTESSGGDQWYDLDTTISTTAAITADGHSVNAGGGGTGNDTYVPVNFKYH